jgi:hypothetical protein
MPIYVPPALHRPSRWRHAIWIICLALGVLLPACAAPVKTACPTEAISIGVITIGSDEASQKAGYEQALAELNRATPGQACPLQLVYPAAESANDPQAAMLSLADKGAVAILGASSDETAKRIAAISDYITTPVLITSESADDILDTGSKQVFRIDPPYQSYALAAFNLVSDALYKANTNVAILYEDSEFAQSAAVTAGNVALDKGYKIVSYEVYTPIEADVTKLLDTTLQNLAAYQKTADINVYYVISTHPEDARRILAEINTRRLSPAFIIGSGDGFTQLNYTDPKNPVQSLAKLVLPIPWSPALAQTSSTRQAAYNLDLTYLASLKQTEAYLSMQLVGRQVQKLAKDSDQFKTENLPKFRANLTDAMKNLVGTQNDPLLAQIVYDDASAQQLAPTLVKVVNGQLVPATSKGN